MDHADHVRADDQRRGGVGPPAHQLREVAVDARVERGRRPRSWPAGGAAARSRSAGARARADAREADAGPPRRPRRRRSKCADVGDHPAAARPGSGSPARSVEPSHSAAGPATSISVGEVSLRSSPTAVLDARERLEARLEPVLQPVQGGVMLLAKPRRRPATLGRRAARRRRRSASAATGAGSPPPAQPRSRRPCLPRDSASSSRRCSCCSIGPGNTSVRAALIAARPARRRVRTWRPRRRGSSPRAFAGCS